MKRSLSLLLASVLLLGGVYFCFQAFKIELKAKAAQTLLQYAWHKTIKTGKNQRPWNSFDGMPVFRLVIPRHEVDQIVLAGTSGQSLAFGPAFHKESILPGNGGTTVISSHRDSHGVYIKNLKKGDMIKLQDHLQQWYSYNIESFHILNVNTDSISKKDDEEVLLLITCFPFGGLTSGTPLRYVVSASQNLLKLNIP